MRLRKTLLTVLILLIGGLPILGPLASGVGQPIHGSELLGIPTAHAQTEGAAMSIADTGGGFQKTMQSAMNVLLVVNWLAFSIVQTLLDPDFLLGKPGGGGVRPIEEALRPIWQFSRDIVNSIFAFILLAGGFYLVLGAGSGNAMTTIKGAAPKFVLSVVLVNFSWFFPRVMIDISNILTNVVFRLPLLMDPATPCSKDPGPDTIWGNGNDTPCDFVWHIHLWPPTVDACNDAITAGNYLAGCPRPAAGNPPPSPGSPAPWRGQRRGRFLDLYTVKLDDIKSTGEAFTLVPVPGSPYPTVMARNIHPYELILSGLAANFNYAIDFGKLELDGLISGNVTGVMDNLDKLYKLISKVLFQVIFLCAIALAMVAFMIVLIVRTVVLWVCIAFMPFIFVGFAMGGNPGDKLGDSFNLWQKFLSYCFLPTMIAIPFSIGFILIRRFIGVTVTDVALNIGGLDNIMQSLGNIYQLLWMAMTIGIVWVGAFTFMEKDSITSKITGGIRGFGEGVIKTGASAVGYAPIPMAGGRSLLGQVDQIKQLPNKFRADSQRRYSELRNKGAKTKTIDTNTEARISTDIGRIDTSRTPDIERTMNLINNARTQADVKPHLKTLETQLREAGMTDARLITSNSDAYEHFVTQAKAQGKVNDTIHTGYLGNQSTINAALGGGAAAGGAAAGGGSDPGATGGIASGKPKTRTPLKTGSIAGSLEDFDGTSTPANQYSVHAVQKMRSALAAAGGDDPGNQADVNRFMHETADRLQAAGRQPQASQLRGLATALGTSPTPTELGHAEQVLSAIDTAIKNGSYTHEKMNDPAEKQRFVKILRDNIGDQSIDEDLILNLINHRREHG